MTATTPAPGPLLEVDPPAAGEAPHRGEPAGRSLARRGAVGALLLAGIPLIGLVVIAALVALNVVLWQLGRVVPALALATLVAVVALGRAVVAMVRRPPDPPDEVEILRDAEPGLHQLVGDLAAAAGTRPPDRVVMIADVNAYVREFGPLMGLVAGHRTLAIGAPLLDVMSVSELRSILGHELGHFVGGDTRLGPLTYRTRQATVELVRSSNGPMATVFGWYLGWQLRLDGGTSRDQELQADRISVAVAGREVSATALRKVEVASAAHDRYLEEYLVPFVATGRLPDPAEGFRCFLSSPQRAAEAAISSRGSAQEDPFATHPPMPERIRQVLSLPEAAPVARDDRVASTLFREPTRWQDLAYERRVRLAIGGSEPARVGWSEVTDQVDPSAIRAAAATVDAALEGIGVPVGLDGLRRAVTGDPDRLVTALALRGHRATDPGSSSADARSAVLAEAVQSVLVRDALDAGCHLRLSWDGPSEVVGPSGEPVDVDGAVRAVLAAPPMATSPPSDPSVRSATPAVGALPEPPPVFTAVAPDRYRIELSALVGKLDLVVHATGLQLGREAVDFDSIRHIRLQLNPGTADLTVELDVGGRNVKVRYHRSGGRAGADRNAQVFAYLWEVVGTQVAPRLQQTLVDQVQAGRLVEVAGLRVGPEGVGSRRVGPVPWSAVGPVVADGLALVVPLGTSGVRVDCGARDAVLVEGLLAGLRAVRA